ncbi:MAG: hypothetical protein JW829_12630 [Pirellulales bacterium]|nr:hypothetical protein [Pirellulales bacterium]
MDTLNRSYAQVRDLFLSMTPAARITAGLLCIAVVISLGYLFHQGTAGPDGFLFGGERLSRNQLDRIEGAFGTAGLSGYEIESCRVRVPRGEEATYMAAIADAGAMPVDFHRLIDQALSAGGMLGSKEDRRLQFKAAREQQLSMIISKMTGVEEAYVLIHESDERSNRSPTLKQRLVTASVNLQAQTEDAIDSQQVKMIRRLVASAVGGKPENVTVADLVGNRVFGGGDSESGDATEDPYYELRHMFENRMRTKILNEVLADIQGVRVAVSAELDPIAEKIETDVKIDPKTVPLTASESSEETTNMDTTPGGLVGMQANTEAIGPNGRANENTSTKQRSNESKKTIEQSDIASAVSHTETKTTHHGFTPRRITASIRIPNTHWENIWRERNKPADGSDPAVPSSKDLEQIEKAEISKLQEAVVTLLNLSQESIQGRDPYPKVNITTYWPRTPEAVEGPSLAQTAMAWTSRNWTTLGMMGLTTFGLVLLRSIVKAVPAPEPSPPAATTFQIDTDETDTDEVAGPNQPRLRLRKGKSLKDDLSEIVREDPNAAAAILRSWIGNAG